MAEKATAGKRSRKKPNGIGHNGVGGEGASQEVFDRWYRKIVESKAATKRAHTTYKTRKSEESNVFKAAKAEHVNTDALKRALKLHDDDHLQVLIDARDEAKYLKWMGSPLGTQMSMFPAPDQLTDVARAMIDGRSAGLAGRSIEDGNKWSPGSEPFIAFRDAWEAGQQQQRETLAE